MTLTLRAAIAADQTVFDISGADTLAEGAIKALGDEYIVIRTVRPATLQYGESANQRVSVDRGALGTVKVAHAAAVELAAVSLGGGAGVTLDNQSDPPAEVTTIVAPGWTLAGDEASPTRVVLRAHWNYFPGVTVVPGDLWRSDGPNAADAVIDEDTGGFLSENGFSDSPLIPMAGTYAVFIQAKYEGGTAVGNVAVCINAIGLNDAIGIAPVANSSLTGAASQPVTGIRIDEFDAGANAVDLVVFWNLADDDVALVRVNYAIVLLGATPE